MMAINSYLIIAIILFSLEIFTNISGKTIPSTELLPNERELLYREFVVNLKNSLNSEVNPCVDYYEYVCSNFDENKNTNSRVITGNNLRDLIEKYSPKTETEKKMMNFLKSCKSAKEKHYSTAKEFLEYFNFPKSIGGWPALESSHWKEEKFNLVSALAELKSYGISNVLNYDSTVDGLLISPQEIYSSKNGMTEDEDAEKRKQALLKIGVNNVEDVINDRNYFVKKLSDVLKNIEETSEVKVKFKDLKEKISEFDWDKYAETIDGKKVNSELNVTVQNFEGLRMMIATISELKPKVVANYFFCQIFDLMREDYENKDSCYDKTLEYFRKIISRFIMDNFYTEGYQKNFLDITRLVMDTAKNTFGALNSTSTESILESAKKVLNGKYLPSLSDTALNKKYSNLEIDPHNYYKNLFELMRSNSKVETLFNEPDDESSIINYNTIAYIFAPVLYLTYKKPMPVVYDRMSIPIILSLTNHIDLPKIYYTAILECLKRQAVEDVEYSISNIEGGIIYIKSFNRWVAENPTIYDQENEIFKDYGLSGKKILFTSLADGACESKYKDIAQNILTKFIKNLRDFAEEYTCPVGAPMNPKEKCDFEPDSDALEQNFDSK